MQGTKPTVSRGAVRGCICEQQRTLELLSVILPSGFRVKLQSNVIVMEPGHMLVASVQALS